jgi:hypothetical protein
MRKFLYVTLTTLAATFLTACNNDEENINRLPKTEAKEKIASLNSSLTSDLEDLANADGFEALRSLFDLTTLDDPFAGRATTKREELRNWFRSKGNELRTIFVKKTDNAGRLSNDEPFNFTAHKGVYEWNFTQETFVKTGNANIIRILFPTEGSATNNAVLQLHQYNEVEVYDEFSEYSYYEPEVIVADLSVNGAEVASLDLSIDWDETGFPLTADITLALTPYTGNLSFDVTGSTSSTASASIRRGSETLFAASITTLFSDPSKSGDSLEKIEGFVQLKDVKLEGNIDFASLDQSSSGNPNEYINLWLSSNGSRLGEIIFVEENVDGFPEWVAYLQYSDGSKEKLEDVLQPILDELEALEDDGFNG